MIKPSSYGDRFSCGVSEVFNNLKPTSTVGPSVKSEKERHKDVCEGSLAMSGTYSIDAMPEEGNKVLIIQKLRERLKESGRQRKSHIRPVRHVFRVVRRNQTINLPARPNAASMKHEDQTSNATGLAEHQAHEPEVRCPENVVLMQQRFDEGGVHF